MEFLKTKRRQEGWKHYEVWPAMKARSFGVIRKCLFGTYLSEEAKSKREETKEGSSLVKWGTAKQYLGVPKSIAEKLYDNTLFGLIRFGIQKFVMM